MSAGIKFQINAPDLAALNAGSRSIDLVPVYSSGIGNRLPDQLTSVAALEGFKANVGQALSVLSAHDPVIYFGLGEPEKFKLNVWREGLIAGVKALRSLAGICSVTLYLPHSFATHAEAVFVRGQAIGDVFTTVLHRPLSYKTDDQSQEKRQVENVFVVFGGSEEYKRRLERGLRQGAIIGGAVVESRNKANEPANTLTPLALARWAQAIGARHPRLNVRVLGRQECEDLGMGSYLAVGSGSGNEPQFITVEYNGRGAPQNGPVLALVGKGLVFDSGGLDIKSTTGMRDMKFDMCGGATVLAAMDAIATLGWPIRVRAYCAATENMPDGRAMRPGDVYFALDGRSIEIDNTDAEGRLTLIDAIAYARLFGDATHIIELSTLTGAIISALGDQAAGVFAHDQALAALFLEAAGAVGERAWQFPTWSEYAEQNQSEIADMKNTGGSKAGSITAALFVLSAAREVPAVHVDIAGVAFRDRTLGGDPKGGTGWGVRTLVEIAFRLAYPDHPRTTRGG